jgi:nucleoside 2-deoxyribosyltransferase
MARDYRGRESEAVDEIVEGDKADINASDAVLAYCPRPSVGTSMEILYCYERGKPCVVVIPPNAPVSPWLTYHALHVTQTIEEGVALLRHAAPS